MTTEGKIQKTKEQQKERKNKIMKTNKTTTK